ncbi:MAG: 50S ribosomal protein L22 [Candidatus Bathyarchaeota archaeon B24]|nr:MAG: 50S ribosomal protein L22 [Candidatus Bathyarchaeota archaeon B24]MCD6443671.1 50S ribosomal protein L22 [Candidatus Bathyarchaeota archaeon]
MPNWGYSVKDLDPEKTVIASGRDLRISPKAAVEVCRAIRGLTLDDAKRLLEDVIALKRSIPFKRYKKKVAHRRDLQGWYAGRYPVKACKAILRVLENAESNAEFKGLNLERLRVIHAAAQRGPILKRYTPRAFGRATPNFEYLTHVEIALVEF